VGESVGAGLAWAGPGWGALAPAAAWPGAARRGRLLLLVAGAGVAFLKKKLQFVVVALACRAEP